MDRIPKEFHFLCIKLDHDWNLFTGGICSSINSLVLESGIFYQKTKPFSFSLTYSPDLLIGVFSRKYLYKDCRKSNKMPKIINLHASI